MNRLSLWVTFFSIGFVSIFLSPCFSDEIKNPEEIEAKFSEKLYLSDLLKYAYLTNPAIEASKSSWEITIEEYRIGKSYPDPQLMTTYYPAPIETRLGPQDWNLTISQTIPFPGTLSQQAKVLEAETRISKLKLDQTIKSITTSITRSFYELGYIQTAIQIAKANFNLNQSLLKISQNAYADEKAHFYDVAKAQAQVAQIQYDILLLEELLQAEKAEINGFLNRSPDAELGVAQELVFRPVKVDINEIYQLSNDYQEDILIAQEKINKSEEAVTLSTFDNLPSFKLGLFYASIGDPDVPSPPPDAGEDAIGIQFGLNIPLWFGKNTSKKSKALAIRQKAKADKQIIANSTKTRISRLWFKLGNAKRLITLYEKQLIPQSLKSVQTAETWFRQGEGSFSDFLELQATSYNFQLSLARAKADYGQTLAQLELLTGVLLDRKTSISKRDTES